MYRRVILFVVATLFVITLVIIITCVIVYKCSRKHQKTPRFAFYSNIPVIFHISYYLVQSMTEIIFIFSALVIQ